MPPSCLPRPSCCRRAAARSLMRERMACAAQPLACSNGRGLCRRARSAPARAAYDVAARARAALSGRRRLGTVASAARAHGLSRTLAHAALAAEMAASGYCTSHGHSALLPTCLYSFHGCFEPSPNSCSMKCPNNGNSFLFLIVSWNWSFHLGQTHPCQSGK